MAKAMLDGKLMYPSEYVAAVEFGGKDVALTISGVELSELRMVDNTVTKKPVLHFSETPKKLVLNKTNANQIAELHGSEARKWVGKRITLFPTTCLAFGKTTDCIRVRPTVPRNKPRGDGQAQEQSPQGGEPETSDGSPPVPADEAQYLDLITGVNEAVSGCTPDLVRSIIADFEQRGVGISYCMVETEARMRVANRKGKR
jgi:hypothetical protein